MSEPLHVLVYGSIDRGVCDRYRFGMFADRLMGEGIELRPWDRHRILVPNQFEDDPAAAVDGGLVDLDRETLDWADVIVFRRWYQTVWACADCDVEPGDRIRLAGHAAATGHEAAEPELLLRPLLATILERPEILRGRAIVYETDDDLLARDPGNGLTRRVAAERDVIETLLRRADLVTVATPVLATVAARYNDAVRVVRNAVDPAWYAAPPVGPPPLGSPRLLYYGVPVRLRDYALCHGAVEAVVAAHPSARRIWLGAANEPAVAAIVDEVGPYVEGLPAFARALVEARPDIGLAPLLDEPFNRAKSELHWLEYSLAGAATVASASAGPGPYDVIRDGHDGLLARTPADWHRALAELAASADRRAELAGRARERILVEYDPAVRAAEWADAYRWAADHAGRGRTARIGRREHAERAERTEPAERRSA